MLTLKDIVIMCDLDGTLVEEDGYTIVPRNKQAVQRFLAAGGRFGIATGRPTDWVRPIAKELQVNVPCVTYNGGVVWDMPTDKTLYQQNLPRHAYQILEVIQEQFPSMSIQVASPEQYAEADRELMDEYRFGRSDSYSPVYPWQTNASQWRKVLFGFREEDFLALATFWNALPSKLTKGTRFVQSHSTLAELLPADSTKARGLQIIAERLSLSPQQVVAIGDYHNDIEMLEYAGLGATLKGSPQEVVQAADMVVGDLHTGGVADVIEYLEEQYGG